MLIYDTSHWLTFAVAGLLLNLSPGPDMAYILHHAITGGRRDGFVAMLGIWSGVMIHVVLATLGLASLLAASAVAFTVVKWVGAAYLIWIGLKAFLRKDGGALPDAPPATRLSSTYRDGVLVAALNPKVAVFFLAFLPQFVVPEAGPVSLQLLVHGVLLIALAGLVEPPLVMLGGQLGRVLAAKPAIYLWLDRVLGGILILLGVRLLFSPR